MSTQIVPQVARLEDPALPNDLFELIAEFLNSPTTYFRLRRCCRSIHSRLPETCPVSREGFLEAIQKFPWGSRSDPARSLRVVRFDSLLAFSDTIEGMLGPDDWEKSMISILPAVDPSHFRMLPARLLDKFLQWCLEGKLPASLARDLAVPLSRLGGGIPEHRVCRLEVLKIVLDELPRPDHQVWVKLLTSYAQAGNLECFALAHERSGLNLRQIEELVNYAVQGLNVDLVRYVIDAGAEVSVFGTDLLLAVFSGSLEVSKLLLERGASANAVAVHRHWFRDEDMDLNAFHLLISRRQQPHDQEIAKLLVANNGDINATRPGLLPIVAAMVGLSRVDLIPIFVELGAQYSLVDAFQKCGIVDTSLVDWMIRRDSDINALCNDDLMGYPVTAAAAWGSFDALTLLIDSKADLSVRGGIMGHTPLTAAIYGVAKWRGSLTADTESKISLLLKLRPTLATETMECGTTPMGVMETYVVEPKDRERIARYLRTNGAGHSQLFGSDWLVRVYSLCGDDVRPDFLESKLVERWKRSGMDLNATCMIHNWASILCKHPRVVEFFRVLLDHGAEFTTNEEVFHVVLRLISDGRVEILPELICKMPDINGHCGVDWHGDEVVNLLSYACTYQYWSLADAVLRADPDVNLRDSSGLSALDSVMLGFDLDILRAGHARDLAQQLLERGADVNARDWRGQTALFRAVTIANHGAVDWLLANGADVDIADFNGVTPFDVASFTANLSYDETSEQASLILANGRTWGFTNIARVNERKQLRRRLGGHVNGPAVRPESAVSFARELGLETLAAALEELPGDGRQSPLFGSGLVRSAHRQWLSDIRARVRAGASLIVTEGTRGHTPLTASITGWAVNGVEASVPKMEVIRYLLSTAPALATTPTAMGEYPMFLVHTTDLTDFEVREISELLVGCGADPDVLCESRYARSVKDNYAILGLRGPNDVPETKLFFPLMIGRKQMDPQTGEMRGISTFANGDMLKKLRKFYTTIPTN